MTDLADRYAIHVGPGGRVELECAPEPRFAFLLTPTQARRLGTKLWAATGPWSEKDWRTMILALRKIRDASSEPLAAGQTSPLATTAAGVTRIIGAKPYPTTPNAPSRFFLRWLL